MNIPDDVREACPFGGPDELHAATKRMIEKDPALRMELAREIITMFMALPKDKDPEKTAMVVQFSVAHMMVILDALIKCIVDELHAAPDITKHPAVKGAIAEGIVKVIDIRNFVPTKHTKPGEYDA